MDGLKAEDTDGPKAEDADGPKPLLGGGGLPGYFFDYASGQWFHNQYQDQGPRYEGPSKR